MNASRKTLTIALIVTIIVAIGATAYIYQQNTKTSNQPTPTPSPTPTVNATVTTNNQTYIIRLGGNITKTQISNLTITPIQSGSTTVVSFNIKGQSGSGFSNMTIPKSAITYGSTPAVYIDGKQTANQDFTQDTNNFYVWYTTQFSTHQVQILFTASSSSTPSPSPLATASPSPSPTTAPTPTATPTPALTTLRVATTTSLYDTGLEDTPETLKNGTVVKDDLKDSFQAKYPWITVNFIPLGTGAAIAQAQRGDADMLLVHSPSQELTYLKGGYGVDRKIVAYNYFIIVGPASDPAHINGLNDTSKALQNIYTAAQNSSGNVLWFSRNDGSGTNTKEISLWTAAGYNYTQLTNTTMNGSWFKSTGTGMGQTLLATNYYGSIGGYTIADTGTYLAYSTRGDIQLKVLVQGQQSLLNVYSAIIDDPRNAALTNTNFAASLLFVNYLASSEGQQLIGNYGITIYNQSLFTPFVPIASGTVSNDTVLGWIKSYAYMSSDSVPVISASGTECPTQYRYNVDTLYSITYVANSNAQLSISHPNYAVTNNKKFSISQTVPSLSSKITKV